MTPLKLALVTGSVVALLTLGGHHLVQRGRLQEAVRLRTENDRLRLEASRQHQAGLAPADAGRANAAPAAASRNESGRVPAANAPVEQSAASSRVPGAEYRNEGQATPVAAMQSLAWSCDRGDTALMERLIHFDEVARPKAVAFHQALPPQVRAQWATPEAMAAALLISGGINSPYPVASIIAGARVEELGAGRKVVLLPGTSRARMEFQETADGWKYAITEAMVDDYIRRANEQAEASR
jgi:hypothetical protein